jgi:predicted small lipoprotein YifL
VRRALAAVLLAAAALAGCGSSGSLEVVDAAPPEGAQDLGITGTKRSSSDPPSRIPRYRVEADDGSPLSFTVRVRNTGSEPVEVSGVEPDPDRDGAFRPERVAGAPVRIEPGAEEELTVEGRVDGCRFGGQIVALAGPALELDDGDQELGLPIHVEVKTTGCE